VRVEKTPTLVRVYPFEGVARQRISVDAVLRTVSPARHGREAVTQWECDLSQLQMSELPVADVDAVITALQELKRTVAQVSSAQ
jgi:hypothetical protein